ncbi:hypothetical protein P280DRAFT_474543 [Massarina eburnea CBS 473.64]|uniref:Uncharacterized protein n=1 Tax=Massarina eburnea CBS 473.64 TaxID=1395130 RepID=A0A6A6RHL4_9PLEO|nr:hypothetical protein P280DRAFT_474543 [Massarina eburnea CBS 473.64]
MHRTQLPVHSRGYGVGSIPGQPNPGQGERSDTALHHSEFRAEGREAHELLSQNQTNENKVLKHQDRQTEHSRINRSPPTTTDDA